VADKYLRGLRVVPAEISKIVLDYYQPASRVLYGMRAIATDIVSSVVCVYRIHVSGTLVSPAKTAEPIQTPFGETDSCVLDGVQIGAIWRIRRNDLCGGDDASCRYHQCINLCACLCYSMLYSVWSSRSRLSTALCSSLSCSSSCSRSSVFSSSRFVRRSVFPPFLPARRYSNAAGTSHDPLSVSVCRSVQVGVSVKRLNESSWVLPRELPLTRPMLC